MIKRFWGSGLGRLAPFDVKLDPLTLLVGPNASGKSTFLRGLRLLALLNRQPLYGEQGALRVGFHASVEDLISRDNAGAEIRLGVEVDSDQGQGRYEIALGNVGDQVAVVDEQAEWNPVSGPAWSFDKNSEPITFNYRGVPISSRLPRSVSLSYLFFAERRRNPELAERLAPLYTLVSHFAPFHVYRFTPASIARPVAAGTPVAPDGNGVAAAIDSLVGSNRVLFGKLLDYLHEPFGHVADVKVVNVPARWSSGKKTPQALKALVFENENGVEILAELESDGVLLTLAYLWLSTRGGEAVGVEEPETAAYPSLVEGRWRLLKTMSEGAWGGRPMQVIATTHSSVLLSTAQDTSLLRIFEFQSDGRSRIYQPSEEFMQEVVYRRLGWAVGAG